MAKPSLFQNGKFKRLLKVHKIPRAHAVGYLECLWHVAYEQADPIIGDADDVEMAAEWEGEAGKLFQALKDCALIDEVGDGQYAVHDLFDHAPEYVQKRAKRRAVSLENKELRKETADKRRTVDRQRQTVSADDRRAAGIPAPPNPFPDSDAGASGVDGAGSGTGQGVKKNERKPASGAHHELIRTFVETWEARYGTKYAFAAGKDGRHIQWILSALVHDLPVARQIVVAYLGDDDPFVAAKCHPLGMLVSNFNKYRVMVTSPERISSGNNNAKPGSRPAAGGGGFVGARRRTPEVIADN